VRIALALRFARETLEAAPRLGSLVGASPFGASAHGEIGT
jgi:hypothetical protein